MVQKLHKQTVGHACWLVGVFLSDVYLQLGNLYLGTGAHGGDTPQAGLGGSIPLGSPRALGGLIQPHVVGSTGSRGHG